MQVISWKSDKLLGSINISREIESSCHICRSVLNHGLLEILGEDHTKNKGTDHDKNAAHHNKSDVEAPQEGGVRSQDKIEQTKSRNYKNEDSGETSEKRDCFANVW